MSELLVCAVMLTKDRPAMAKRAVECFRAQTYQNKFMIVWNNGERDLDWTDADIRDGIYDVKMCGVNCKRSTIGELRNSANMWASIPDFQRLNPKPAILIHWDDDDWSHPNRIAEQVALLQASGKQAVGYRYMLFWRTCGVCDSGRGNILPRCPSCGIEYNPSREVPTGEVWLYHNDDQRKPIGSSLCYWRETWERHPFRPVQRGEDFYWLQNVEALGVSSIHSSSVGLKAGGVVQVEVESNNPRMICSIHSGNHVPYDLSGPSWKRVPEWDAKLRETMTL